MLWRKIFNLLTASLLLNSLAHADMTIDVVGVGASQYPIAIAPFQNENQQKQALTPIINDDLTRSGLFKVIGAGDLSPVPFAPEQLNYTTALAKGAQTMAIGRVTPGAGGFNVQFWLIDLASKKPLITWERKATASQMRRVAHQIADLIYQQITGQPGAFNSRIAYVLKQGSRFELQVSDADGFGSQAILVSRQPVMSPKWSPDGGKLAYVSFEDQKPIVYVHELASGRRWKAASFKGSNYAPAWSPNGRELAVVLTQSGSSQIYLVNTDGSDLRQLSRGGEINTEPAFSPDGRSIYFTSDRGGSPQIYRMNSNGSNIERVTFQGGYNSSAKLSPDGKSMTFITRDGGYRAAIMDLSSRQVLTLTNTSSDDSPSFAPNGQMVLYETKAGGRGVLAAVSSDGRVKQRLRAQAGDVRQPAWGPVLR
ncbi:Tol-Pal system beta propeller repeat protein TolB [Iodobacter ciconiae]|uniref:Tol-Pal system protein TolB n=1 Tax=Iodobacter ciconiae TaxID=2496266 RepID=A0A3S8ZV96_9NEIS|nr:Tol-Pal system beta propeller repeat protein TolB [Iodobacter ciconiae]AZN37402.1 Tol-Pal system protein TolB [Iodobacter ciconiae]